MARAPYRRHSPQFKLRLCQHIRAGAIGRREAQAKYRLSSSLIQRWLTQYDLGELDGAEPARAASGEHEAKVAALERKLAELASELDALKRLLRAQRC